MKNVIGHLANFLRSRPVLGRAALWVLPDIGWTLTIEPLGRFQIRLRRHRSFWLRSPFQHEGFVLGCFRRFVRPGCVVYDIGANIGLYVRLLCSCFAAGQVVGFEPMTENLKLLISNIKLGNLGDRARVYPYALADDDREEDLQLDDVMSASAALDSVTHGQPSLGRQKYGLGPKTERVVVRKLDTVVEQQGLALPDVIKIDVEGAEGMVLRGAGRVLARCHPRIIVECHGVEQVRAVFDILDGAGYTLAGYLKQDDRRDYTIIRRKHVDKLNDFYDLRHIAASVIADELEEPIQLVKPEELTRHARTSDGSDRLAIPA